MSSGLGYELDPAMECQPTPKRVDALSEDCVVGVALGHGFTLAVTDAGVVFSFGDGGDGVLGHGSLEAEVLPRRIEALAQTGRRFVAVAAGDRHSLALTEGGDLYGWGDGRTNGHGCDERTARQVAAFVGQRVKLVCTGAVSSRAVTDQGELFTWGSGVRGKLGHGDEEGQQTPKRVEGLRGVKVVATALCETHTLVADEDGVVWAFGVRSALGLGDPDEESDSELPEDMLMPSPIPALRVRARKFPDVLPFR
jgi:alpha-tubulin suppressor-like RCC1 family protein